MKSEPDWLKRARSSWQNTGQKRPDFAAEPGPDQESVWDYPRPPVLVPDSRHVTVIAETGDGTEVTIVDTTTSVRLLETASPPTFYFSPADVNTAALSRAAGTSHCEWKGEAQYWGLTGTGPAVGWSYPKPYGEFTEIAGWFSFYPALTRCQVDGKPVLPQPGRFYGGWLTDEIVGPVKGEPGSQSW